MSHKKERENRRIERMKWDLWRQTAVKFPGLPHISQCLFTHVERSGIEVLVGEQLKLTSPLNLKLMSGQLYGDNYIALAIHRTPEELVEMQKEIAQHVQVKLQEAQHDVTEPDQGAAPIPGPEGGQGPVGPMGDTAADGERAEAPLPGQEIQAGPLCEEGQGPLPSQESLLPGRGVAQVIPPVIGRCGAGEPTISEDPPSDGGQAGQ